MIQAIIFDCFGVLVGRGFGETYRYAGGDPQKDGSFIEDIMGQMNLGLISATEFDEQIAAKLGIAMADYHHALIEAERPNAQLLDFIESLRPRYKTAILSNAAAGSVEGNIGLERIERCFDAKVISAEVGTVKPDPRIYELAASKLDVATNECVFIDDQERYCLAARDVGMQAICYKDFQQCKGDLEKLLAK